MVSLVELVHQHAVDQDEQYEDQDGALVGKPETNRKPSARQREPVEPVGQQDPPTEPDCRPDEQQVRRDPIVAKPVPIEQRPHDAQVEIGSIV